MSATKTLRQEAGGFTVVELLITVAICGVIVPVLAAGLTQLTMVNNRARDLALANMLAQSKAELLRNAGYNSIGLGVVDFSGELPSTFSAPRSGNYTVTEPEIGIKDIAIQISYKEANNQRTINYETKISEIGVGQ